MIRMAAAQYPIGRHTSWELWQSHMRKWISDAVQNKAQVLVFPEYGSMELVSLLSDEVQNDLKLQVGEMESFRQKFLQFFSREAVAHGVAILAPTLPLKESGFRLPVNRAYFFKPDGSFDFQDKVCMTRFEDEAWGVGPGIADLKVFEAFGVKFGISICFDVEFPQGPHALAKKGVEVLLAPSCTEAPAGMNRVHVGARARALENQYFVVVSQTVGTADWSQVCDKNTGKAAFYSTCDVGFPDDGILAQGTLNEAQWVYCDLNIDRIEKVRNRGQVFNFKWMKKNNVH